MHLIVCINDGVEIRHILDHIGETFTPPWISQACDPALWDACDETETMDHFGAGPRWNVVQHGIDGNVDQSVNW